MDAKLLPFSSSFTSSLLALFRLFPSDRRAHCYLGSSVHQMEDIEARLGIIVVPARTYWYECFVLRVPL